MEWGNLQEKGKKNLKSAWADIKYATKKQEN